MSDQPDLAAIRERLDKALELAPEPWELQKDPRDGLCTVWYGEGNDQVTDCGDAFSEWLAAAPADLRVLLAHVEGQAERIAQVELFMDRLRLDLCQQEGRAERLEAENGRLREALRPFATYISEQEQDATVLLRLDTAPLTPWRAGPTLGDCRRAREVLTDEQA